MHSLYSPPGVHPAQEGPCGLQVGGRNQEVGGADDQGPEPGDPGTRAQTQGGTQVYGDGGTHGGTGVSRLHQPTGGSSHSILQALYVAIFLVKGVKIMQFVSNLLLPSNFLNYMPNFVK